MTRVTQSLVITTNHVPRELIDGATLTGSERSQFDYLDWTAIDAGTDSATFFRYRGELYSLDQFMRVETDTLATWDGVAPDSFFSGMLIRIVEADGDTCIVVGRYYVKG